MKKIIILSFASLLVFMSQQAIAQISVTSTNRGVQENRFASRLWYGGGFVLGFAGGNQESLFQLGAAPMVGYKIFEEFSIGPRVSLVYSHYRVNLGFDVEKANTVSWSAGAFTRYKLLRNIFAHAEFEFENTPVYTFTNLGLEVLRRERNNFYIGAGYNSGGVWGYEIMVLYNTLAPENDINPPFSFRVGFTHNF